MMDTMDKRLLIYTALIILCGAASTFTGMAGGMWSFVQIVAVIELTHWIGTHSGDFTRS